MLNVFSAFLTLMFFSTAILAANNDSFTLADVMKAESRLQGVSSREEAQLFEGHFIELNGQKAQIIKFDFNVNKQDLEECKEAFSSTIAAMFNSKTATFGRLGPLALSQHIKDKAQPYVRSWAYKERNEWPTMWGKLWAKTTKAERTDDKNLFVFANEFYIYNFYSLTSAACEALRITEDFSKKLVFSYSLQIRLTPQEEEQADSL